MARMSAPATPSGANAKAAANRWNGFLILSIMLRPSDWSPRNKAFSGKACPHESGGEHRFPVRNGRHGPRRLDRTRSNWHERSGSPTRHADLSTPDLPHRHEDLPAALLHLVER